MTQEEETLPLELKITIKEEGTHRAPSSHEALSKHLTYDYDK